MLLHRNGKFTIEKLKSVGIKEALKMFIFFLAQYKKNIVIGHNIKSYDISVLFCALNNCLFSILRF